MKQIYTFAIVSLFSTFVSCSRDENTVIKSKKDVEIDLNIAKTEADTRALQTGFLNGNTIFLIFNGELSYKNGAGFDVNHCLQLTYDGSEWKSTIDQDYLNHLPATGTMDAIYVSCIPDGAMNFSSSGGNIDIQTKKLSNDINGRLVYDALICEGAAYSITSDGKLTGDIKLERKNPQGSNIRINRQVSVSGLADGEWYLMCDALNATSIGFTAENDGDSFKPHFETLVSGSYLSMSRINDDYVTYGSASAIIPDETTTFHLYNATTNTEYTYSLGNGNDSQSTSFYSKWSPDGDITGNLAIKLRFSNFTDESFTVSKFLDKMLTETMYSKNLWGLSWGSKLIRKYSDGINDADMTFVGHYYVDKTNSSIHFTFYKNGTITRFTPELEVQGNTLKFKTPVSYDDAIMTGFTLDNSAGYDHPVINLDGMKDEWSFINNNSWGRGDSDWLPMPDYIMKNSTGVQWIFKDADLTISDNMKEEYAKSYKIVQWNGEWQSLVIYGSTGYYFIKYQYDDKSLNEHLPISGTDVIRFNKNAGIYPGFNDSATMDAFQAEFPNIYNFMFNEDHIIVRESHDKKAPLIIMSTSSDSFIYFPGATS